MGSGLPTADGPPAFAPKERDSWVPYTLVIAIVMSLPELLALVVVIIPVPLVLAIVILLPELLVAIVLVMVLMAVVIVIVLVAVVAGMVLENGMDMVDGATGSPDNV